MIVVPESLRNNNKVLGKLRGRRQTVQHGKRKLSTQGVKRAGRKDLAQRTRKHNPQNTKPTCLGTLFPIYC
jgi:hypothetical protein